ncbi:MAG TPA: hypothetical protein PKA90_15365 [Ignavibacteria bacterium]|nr:hypothetical protein [Ignavibacteria bacterium]HMR41797.1 hypothetical protein [Ignavibacteria bacterium]
MDLEKVKNSYKWDPMGGDYSKSYVSYERKEIKKKKIRGLLFTSLYVVLLVIIVIVLFVKFL